MAMMDEKCILDINAKFFVELWTKFYVITDVSPPPLFFLAGFFWCIGKSHNHYIFIIVAGILQYPSLWPKCK